MPRADPRPVLHREGLLAHGFKIGPWPDIPCMDLPAAYQPGLAAARTRHHEVLDGCASPIWRREDHPLVRETVVRVKECLPGPAAVVLLFC